MPGAPVRQRVIGSRRERCILKVCRLLVAGALILAGCSGAGSPDLVSSDVGGDTASDVIADVAADAVDDTARPDAADVAQDPGQVDTVVSDSIDDAADAADAAEVADDVPDLPWFERLVPEGLPLNRIVGVASHMETSEAGDAQTDFEFDQYLAAGGMRARRGFRWSTVEPVEGEFHWDRTNGAVTRAAEHSVTLMPVVYYGNDWAEDETSAYGSLDITKYANYAGAMATQYCATVKEYELWNEQNITRFWHIPPDPAKYADMLALASTAIKAACPDAKVEFGGMASYDDVDMFDTWNYLRRALAARPDLCGYLDGVALHPYTFLQFDSPEYDEVDYDYAKRGQTWMTQVARDMLADAGCGDKDIFYTELGWPSYDLSKETVAKYAVRSLLLAARDSVEGWYWYTFWDDDPADASPVRPHENYFGLWEFPGTDDTVRTPKPAWNALLAAIDAAGPGRFAGDVGAMLGLPDDVYVLAFVDDGGAMTLAMWDGRDQPDMIYGKTGEGGPETTFDLVLPLPSGITGTTLLDLYGVELAAAGAETSIALTLTPSVKYLVINR